jgi:hypothetical protein
VTEVLDRSVTSEGAGPAPVTRPTPSRRLGVRTAMSGAAMMVVGLLADTLGADEADALLLLAGAAGVVAGLLLAAVGPALYDAPGPVGPARRTVQVAAPLVAVALLIALVVMGAARADRGSVAADDSAGTEAGHDHPVPAPAPQGNAEAEGVTGTGGHVHGEGPPVPLDAPTQKALSAELAATYAATARYPTVADALADSLKPVGRYAPGSGAHYMKDVPRGEFDPAVPTMWLYAGDEPTSPVVGVMFYSMNMKAPPEGYTGPNDHWHMHTGLCLTYEQGAIGLPLPVDKDATPEQCKAVNGRFMDVTGWMIHVWSAPGWESPKGVFSHDNPQLVCSDGTKAADAPLHVGCPGMA